MRTLDPFDPGICRPRAKKTFQRGKRLIRAINHDFDTSIREVPGVPCQAYSPRVSGNVPAESNSLNHAEHHEPCRHAGRLRRVRSISIAIGRIEIAMIARMTRLKFSRTTAMLPKK